MAIEEGAETNVYYNISCIGFMKKKGTKYSVFVTPLFILNAEFCILR
jgi:hypothetical protein